jgi:uncharacterized lipoprotein YehR (DUF1307 family)
VKYHSLALVAAAAALSACSDAQKASEVTAQYVPATQYDRMSCRALAEEAARLQSSVAGMEAEVDKAYKQDKTMEAVTWILFWPAVFAMDGNETEAGRLAQARGEAEAIRTAMTQKGCRA